MKRNRKASSSPSAARPAGPEAAGWSAAVAAGPPASSRFEAPGFAFEWHEYATGDAVDWACGDSAERVQLWLNLEGRATLAGRDGTVEVAPHTSVVFMSGEPPLVARRCANEFHRFVTAGFSRAFLRQHLQQAVHDLRPAVRELVTRPGVAPVIGAPEPMSVALFQWVESLKRCPVHRSAQGLWFRCKALELAAQSLFELPPGEPPCTRQERAACERAGRVRQILCERLADPPTLEELGRLVGCSPFYLSRQFSEATGHTIQQFLRRARLERAAELLRGGGHNVTQAALAVGYNSLSHFTVAFREVFGCCPGLYPLRTVPAASLAPKPAEPPLATA